MKTPLRYREPTPVNWPLLTFLLVFVGTAVIFLVALYTASLPGPL